MFNVLQSLILVSFYSFYTAIYCQTDQGQVKDSSGETIRTFKAIESKGINPSKGWMTFQYLPRMEPRFPGTVAYSRFDWTDLEPLEGKYNWHIIDTALTAWANKGRRFAFRIMTSNPHSKKYYSTPQWVFDKGCKGFEYVYENSITNANSKKLKRIEVDYSDSIFLIHHTQFIKALANRYDGNKDIEFIDIGSYGLWGEWHTRHSATYEVKRTIFNMYMNNFEETKLLALSLDAAILEYSIKNSIGFRRDGIGLLLDSIFWYDKKRYNHDLVLKAWKDVPVAMEWYSRFDILESNAKCSFATGLRFMYDNHVTYILDNLGEVPDTILLELKKLGRKSGYNIVLEEIRHKSKVSKGDNIFIEMKWINEGIAPNYQILELLIYLIERKSDKEYSVGNSTQIATWLPGNHLIKKTVLVPDNIKSGKYIIGISLKELKSQKNISIPIDAIVNNNIYFISEIEIH